MPVVAGRQPVRATSITIVVVVPSDAGDDTPIAFDALRAALRRDDRIRVVAVEPLAPIDPFCFAPAPVHRVGAADLQAGIDAAVAAATTDLVVVLDQPVAVPIDWLDGFLAAGARVRFVSAESVVAPVVGSPAAADPAALAALAAQHPLAEERRRAHAALVDALARSESVRVRTLVDRALTAALRAGADMTEVARDMALASAGDAPAFGRLVGSALGDRAEDGDDLFPSAWPAAAALVTDELARRELAAVAARSTEELRRVLARVQFAQPHVVDRFAEDVWSDDEPALPVLALATLFANRLDLSRALEWAVRLRNHGLVEECPVRAIAADPARDAAERVRAAALLWSMGDDEAIPAFTGACTALPDAELAASLLEVATLEPEAVDAFVVAAATTPARALAVAGCLFEHGATDGAVTLVHHAFELAEHEGVDPGALASAATALLPPRIAVALADLAAARGELRLSLLLTAA